MIRKVNFLNEITKAGLLFIFKKDTPDRFRRRLKVSVSSISDINFYRLRDEGVLEFTIDVVGHRGTIYSVTIEMNEFVKILREAVENQKPLYRAVERAIRNCLNRADIKVNCTCPDFIYRFAYVATIKQFKSGQPELRPALQTNPDNKGSVCKHIARVLMGTDKWIRPLRKRLLVEIKRNRIPLSDPTPPSGEVNIDGTSE